MKNNNTSPDNQPNQTSDHAARQAKRTAKRTGVTPAERTADAGYQKLPRQYRPKVSRDQRDPIAYDSHPHPSMKRFAEFLTLRFDAPRTRHSYYRQIGLVGKFCQCDPASLSEERFRDYILHVKTHKLWKPKTIRHVLPSGLRAIRYHGFCHPAAKVKRERIAFHTGRPLLIGASVKPEAKPPRRVSCPCCGGEMKPIFHVLPAWRSARPPPPMRATRA